MFACTIAWRGTVLGLETVADIFGRHGDRLPSKIMRGDAENPNALAQIIHERRGAGGLGLSVTTHILLANGGRPEDLHGRTEVIVSQPASKRHAGAMAMVACSFPDQTWEGKRQITPRASPAMRGLGRRLDQIFTEIATRAKAGSGELSIGNALHANDARRLLEELAAWAAASVRRWHVIKG